MRIAYVALHLENVIMNGGVGHKIASQLRIWQDMEHQAQLFLHTPDDLTFPLTATFRYPYESKPAIPGLLNREAARTRALSNLVGALHVYQPDIIYLRYGMFALPLQRLFNFAPVVVELNGDDVNEYRHRGTLYYLLNRVTRRITMSRASGYVCLSHEIAALASNTKYQKPTAVIANGIDLREYHPLPAPDNEKPRLSMVCSAQFDWHGVDKLLWLASQYPDLTFDLIGHGFEDIKDSAPANVIFHGFLNRQAIRQVLALSDVSLGTLALHRKQMEEASPLKVREALAYGIPTVLAYTDTDFANYADDFLLRLPNTADNVRENAARIRDFAYAMRGKRAPIQKIAPLIDQRAKEEKRLAFFETI